MASTVIYSGLSLDEKEEAGKGCAANVTAACPDDPVAQSLAKELERDSLALNTGASSSPRPRNIDPI